MFLKVLLAVATAVTSMTAWATSPQDSTLNRALALEHSGQFELARQAYQVAATDAADFQAKRPALLGLARVARAQARLQDARSIYSELLARDPADLDATNGLAWTSLADYDVAQAQQGFRKTLSQSPENAEALTGLKHADETSRYQLDVMGSHLHNDFGSLWGASVGFAAAIDARQQVDAAVRRNSVDVGLLDQFSTGRMTSTTSATFGYRWRAPETLSIRVGAERIERTAFATQWRLGVDAEYPLTDGLRLSGGLRQSFGNGWRSQLRQVGLGMDVGANWQVVVRLYSEHNREQSTHRRALALEAVRQGPGHMLWVMGASHGTAPKATDVYGRAVLPVGNHGAVLATIRHLSLNRETQVELGWRKYWN